MGSVDHFSSDRKYAGVRLRDEASTIAWAWASSSADGVNASLIGPTWAGWMASLPVNPSDAAARASAIRPGLVAEVGENAIDRLDLGRGRAGQA